MPRYRLSWLVSSLQLKLESGVTDGEVYSLDIFDIDLSASRFGISNGR